MIAAKEEEAMAAPDKPDQDGIPGSRRHPRTAATCRPAPRFGWAALTLAAVVAVVSTRCGGGQASRTVDGADAEDLPAQVVLESERGRRPVVAHPGDLRGAPVLIGGAPVRASWLGARWGGAAARLAANPGAVDGRCTDAPWQAADHRFVLPAADLVGIDAPADSTAIITVVGVREADGCPQRGEEGGWIVSRIEFGALMVVAGPVPADATTPAEVLVGGGELVEALGWSVRDSEWVPETRAILATLAMDDRDPAPIACAEQDGLESAEALADAWLRATLGAPTTARLAREELARRATAVGGEAGALLSDLAAGTFDPEAWAPTPERAERCDGSPVWSFAAMLAAAAAGATDDALAWSGIDRRERTRSGPLATAAGCVAAEAGHVTIATNLFERALETRTGYGPALLQWGTIQRDVNAQFEPALSAFESAEGDETWRALALYELALTYEDLGEVSSALEAFGAAMEADAAYADPANALGFLLFESGDIDGAQRYFEATIARDPDHSGAHNNLAFLLDNARGDHRRARELFETAVALDPENPSAHYNLGDVLERRFGALADAEDAYTRALELEPGHIEARTALQSLRERPEASMDTLVGSWSAAIAEPLGPTTVLATFLEPSSLSFVRRVSGGPPTTTRYTTRVEWLRGPQIGLSLDGEDGPAELVVEFVADDVVVLFDPSDPVTTRIRYERRTGGGVARASGGARG